MKTPQFLIAPALAVVFASGCGTSVLDQAYTGPQAMYGLPIEVAGMHVSEKGELHLEASHKGRFYNYYGRLPRLAGGAKSIVSLRQVNTKPDVSYKWTIAPLAWEEWPRFRKRTLEELVDQSKQAAPVEEFGIEAQFGKVRRYSDAISSRTKDVYLIVWGDRPKPDLNYVEIKEADLREAARRTFAAQYEDNDGSLPLLFPLKKTLITGGELMFLLFYPSNGAYYLLSLPPTYPAKLSKPSDAAFAAIFIPALADGYLQDALGR